MDYKDADNSHQVPRLRVRRMNKVESGSDQGSPRASVVHNLQVAVASYAELCPETLCSRNALQQQLAFMHNSDAGDSCQAAIGPSPQKKKTVVSARKRKQNKQVARPPGRVCIAVSWCLGVKRCAHKIPAYPCNRGALHGAGGSSSEADVADDAEAAALEETTATAA